MPENERQGYSRRGMTMSVSSLNNGKWQRYTENKNNTTTIKIPINKEYGKTVYTKSIVFHSTKLYIHSKLLFNITLIT